jgi:hypothetical protein
MPSAKVSKKQYLKLKITSMDAAQLNPNSPDFDYCEWIQTEPTQAEFLSVWQQLTDKEKAAVLTDYHLWLTANR